MQLISHGVAFAFLSLCAFSSAVTLDDVFTVTSGTAEGSCDQHRPLLDNLFAEIQSLNTQAVSSLTTDHYNSDGETRKLAKSLFGITENSQGKEPTIAMDLARLTKVRGWYKDLEAEITETQEGVSKTHLYCDSTFLEYLRPDALARDLNGNLIPNPDGTLKTVEEDVGVDKMNEENHWWVTDQNAYYTEFKPRGSRNAPYATYARMPDNPTYCATKGNNGLTGEANEFGMIYPFIILCPESFQIQGAAVSVDTSPQDEGKVLDEMQTLSLTFYHEMFHLTNDPTPNGPGRFTIESPDAVVYRALSRKDRADVIRAGWPGRKDLFVKDAKQATHGAITCMYLALFDQARPVKRAVQDMMATKNPETYVWFALANYLSVVGSEHQDWSSGACREQDSDAERVTVTEGMVARRTAAPTQHTAAAPEDASTSSIFTA